MKKTHPSCPHLGAVDLDTHPKSRGCAECVAMGDAWVHLRLCLACGNVGCCDDSKNRHATKHFEGTGHPIIRSLESGENWGWCFVDKVTFDPLIE